MKNEINEATAGAFISKERGDDLIEKLWAAIKAAVAVEDELEHYNKLLEEKVESNAANSTELELYRDVSEALFYVNEEKHRMERLFRITKRWEENARKALEEDENL